ncbi:hypothetical protein CKM354_000957000 [Cercospora kikuchii]|uniref:Major facilitator superfamily (MFS) profile domain-containing protein n=1 Tax=Cercospora kikuchii TaxID=84275 RepID=A0A9P3CP98_9PEZI|nr:uncharacterized protein CKM354_000957000 [Cercospora kikuchii]GIZ46444.1 hypothetical protein CKM354_000957000 [Cercospora kikuchii]
MSQLGIMTQHSGLPAPGHDDHNIAKFLPEDAQNPRNWSAFRKWTIVASIGLVDLTVSFGASGFSPASSDFAAHFGLSSEIAGIGLSIFVLGLAFGPMFIAPLSEYYGRTALYLIPYGIFLVCLALSAAIDNVPGFFVLRFFSGLFASVTIANFGGSIADLFSKNDVGPAMNIFLWAAVCGSPMGFFLMSLVAQSHGWRAVLWTLFGICAVLWAQLLVVLVPFGNETRHTVLLRRRARRHGKAIPDEAQARSLKTLFTVTLARPFRFLSTETIVIFGALYNGFLYGISFLFNGAFGLVFGERGYGFDTLGVGLCFTGFIVGISLGPVTGIWQERYYQKSIQVGQTFSTGSGSSVESEASALLEPSRTGAVRHNPEARVQLGKVAAVALPISLAWFAWTAASKHWILPILATSLFGWSFFTLIFMVAIYTEESYMVYSASALAGIGLARNVVGAIFPLIGNVMFERLGPRTAGSIIAGLALLLAPIPFILERYGPNLRARSPFAYEHADDE